MLVSAVLLLLVGLDRGGNLSITDPFVLGAFGGSLALFILFAVVEKYVAAEPFAPPHIVMEHTILACSLANFFSFAGYMGVIFYVPLYYQAVAGYSAGEAGLRLLPAIVGAVSGSLAGGIIMQRTGRYYWLTFGAYSLCVVGAVALFLCSGIATRSVPAMVVALSALSCGNGLGVTSTLIGLISAAGPEDQAVATAVSYLFRSLGTVSGVSVSSMLVQGALRRKLHEVLTGDDADEVGLPLPLDRKGYRLICVFCRLSAASVSPSTCSSTCRLPPHASLSLATSRPSTRRSSSASASPFAPCWPPPSSARRNCLSKLSR